MSGESWRCGATVKTGPRKGKRCGYASKRPGGRCGRHGGTV